MKKMFLLGLSALMALGLTTTAFAFHSGGVAECDGCHTMHNSLDGTAMTDILPQYQSGIYLLQGNTQSEACLNCHEAGPGSYHISTPEASAPAGTAPFQYTPGGDFRYVTKDYTWVQRGSTATDLGERHGHNVNAPAYGYNPDTTQITAPGGSYPGSSLACSSCHDPHGKYRRDAAGNISNTGLPISGSGSYNNSGDPISGVTAVGVYRILGGINYAPVSTPGFPFVNDPPAAVVQSSYNASEATSQLKVAYGSGMSEWCANCHGQMYENAYTSGAVSHTHPAANSETLDSFIVANYNSYVKSGDLTGGQATSYLSLVPYEEGISDYATLKTTTVKGATLPGPSTGTENVMCLSCHRAHATGFASMMRWNMESEFLTEATAAGVATYAGTTSGINGKAAEGRTEAELTAAYYGRPATFWAPYQRSLCNKCHAKD